MEGCYRDLDIELLEGVDLALDWAAMKRAILWRRGGRARGRDAFDRVRRFRLILLGVVVRLWEQLQHI